MGGGDARGGLGAGGKYVPPSMRNRGDGDGPAGESMGGPGGRDRRDDYYTVRVSNLSEDANEDDLHAMFRKSGTLHGCFARGTRRRACAEGLRLSVIIARRMR